MRFHNQTNTFKKYFLGKISIYFFFILSLYIFYKLFLLYPTWFHSKQKYLDSERLLQERQREVENEMELQKDENSDMGKERYKKDFFNALDKGEELIVLYTASKTEQKIDEKKLELVFWEEWIQAFKVWWKNL